MLNRLGRSQLSQEEANYLRALRDRFAQMDDLMRPLPTALSLAVRSELPRSHPMYRESLLRLRLNLRKARIQAKSRDVEINSKLLSAFEAEMDYLHDSNYLPRAVSHLRH